MSVWLLLLLLLLLLTVAAAAAVHASAELQVPFNAVNVNVYDEQAAHLAGAGGSALARHRDDESIFACEVVASLSFGASRRFVIYHPDGGRRCLSLPFFLSPSLRLAAVSLSV